MLCSTCFHSLETHIIEINNIGYMENEGGLYILLENMVVFLEKKVILLKLQRQSRTQYFVGNAKYMVNFLFPLCMRILGINL